jgi:hypothetical protein
MRSPGIISSDHMVEVYALGMMSCSVCASNRLSIKEVEAIVNEIAPTGIKSQWRKSADTHFKGGKYTNPCECEEMPNQRRHILMEC